MMPGLSTEARGLLSSLPVIRRVRGFRLYASNGERYLDMFVDGGRTVMGRRNGSADRAAAECLDRGLVSSFPSFWEERLLKALSAWLPGYAEACFFASETDALLALASADENFALSLRSGTPFPAALSGFAARLSVEAPLGGHRKDLTEGSSAFDGRPTLAILPLEPALSFGVALGKSAGDLEAVSTSALTGRAPACGAGDKKLMTAAVSEWSGASLPVPAAHRRMLRTTNMLERLNRELKKRTKIASIFPNEESLLRLVGAMLMETAEHWLGEKRYLPVDSEARNLQKEARLIPENSMPFSINSFALQI